MLGQFQIVIEIKLFQILFVLLRLRAIPSQHGQFPRQLTELLFLMNLVLSEMQQQLLQVEWRRCLYTTQLNMEYEQKNNLELFDYYMELFPETQILAQDHFTSCKTLPAYSSTELTSAITQLKQVKVGRRRDFKLMKENIDSFKHVVPQNRRLHKKMSIALTSEIDNQVLTSQSIRKLKKIHKKTNKPTKCRKSEVDDITQSSRKCEFSDEENKKQNIQEKQRIFSLSAKGLKLQKSIARGQRGHSTLLFGHEIIEGAYYLEFRVINCRNQSDSTGKPDIRIGVCTQNHKQDTPLGYKNSIGFSLGRKDIVTEGCRTTLTQQSQKLQSCSIKAGDIIGMMVSFSPPYKCPNPLKNWEESSLKFYLNGELVGEYSQLKQIFYQPAISLYNEAQLEIRIKEHEMRFMPQNCVAYERIRQYKNIYA